MHFTEIISKIHLICLNLGQKDLKSVFNQNEITPTCQSELSIYCSFLKVNSQINP